MGGFENKQVISYQNIEELTRNIEGHSFRVLKKDCLDLPDKIYQRHYVEMTDKQKKIYTTMKKAFIAEMEGEVIEATEGNYKNFKTSTNTLWLVSWRKRCKTNRR